MRMSKGVDEKYLWMTAVNNFIVQRLLFYSSGDLSLFCLKLFYSFKFWEIKKIDANEEIVATHYTL